MAQHSAVKRDITSHPTTTTSCISSRVLKVAEELQRCLRFHWKQLARIDWIFKSYYVAGHPPENWILTTGQNGRDFYFTRERGTTTWEMMMAWNGLNEELIPHMPRLGFEYLFLSWGIEELLFKSNFIPLSSRLISASCFPVAVCSKLPRLRPSNYCTVGS